MSLMDVVLDSPVYSASVTGYDALSMGIPIVTLPGRLMVQCCARGLYTQMGISDLIVGDEEAYVDLAVRLGRERGFRQSMSRTRAWSAAAHLYGDDRVVGECEGFFELVCR